MLILLFGLTSGLVTTSWANTRQGVRLRSCSFVGVYHIQGNNRYSLNFNEAQELCENLGATLANEAQMNDAYVEGFQTCRYGWTSDGNITIPRQTANHVCAGNQTGLIVINSTESHYDAYCYDGTDLSVRNCTLMMNLDSSDAGTDPTPLHTAGTEKPSDGADRENFSLAVTEQPTAKPRESQTGKDYWSETVTETAGSPAETTEASPHMVGPKEAHPWPRQPAGTTAFVTQMDSGGSSMGEASTKEISEFSSEAGPHENGVTDATGESNEESTVSEAPDQTEPNHDHEGDKGPADNDWLIIVGVVVAVVAILLVCAAVATRKRWCGRQQTLMITTKSTSEGNGATASATSSRAQEREQEMVTLMNKEKIQENGNPEEFTVITLEESSEKKEQA